MIHYIHDISWIKECKSNQNLLKVLAFYKLINLHSSALIVAQSQGVLCEASKCIERNVTTIDWCVSNVMYC